MIFCGDKMMPRIVLQGAIATLTDLFSSGTVPAAFDSLIDVTSDVVSTLKDTWVTKPPQIKPVPPDSDPDINAAVNSGGGVNAPPAACFGPGSSDRLAYWNRYSTGDITDAGSAAYFALTLSEDGPVHLGVAITKIDASAMTWRWQFVTYIRLYRKDPVGLKVTVAILAHMTCAKSVQALCVSHLAGRWDSYICIQQLLWFRLVVHHGDFERSMQVRYTNFWTWSAGIAGATITFYVQNYFCWRLFKIFKQWYPAFPVELLLFGAWAINVVSTYFVAKGPTHSRDVVKYFDIYLPCVVTGDILLTTMTALFLMNTKQHVPESAEVLKCQPQTPFDSVQTSSREI
ncbi:hypothetical protein C8R43DRAFT_1231808 [Mycena crocata]|nr:hypothetical protein C8R43DRAFT_1231808 [Mycena crocata]